MNRRATPRSVLGELLLTAGTLVLLFLGWQLVWTDVTAGAASAATSDAVEARFASAGAFAGATERATTSGGGDPVRTQAPPSGDAVGLVHVPRFGPGWSVAALEGTDRGSVLDRGVLGRYDGTAMPGEIGNLALAGHRTTYGAPLSRIDELVAGDPVVVETLQGWFSYRVSGHEIVTPDRVDVIAPVPGEPGEAPTAGALTLTACHPRFSARLRYVVHADLVAQTPREQGAPQALEPAAAPARAQG